jgi:hypothetical protein
MDLYRNPETLVSYKKCRQVKTQKPLYNITTAAKAFIHIFRNFSFDLLYIYNFFENASKFKHLGTTLTNTNEMCVVIRRV